MSKVEFNYNGAKTIIQCQSNEKMKNICQNFANKIQINKNEIYFLYDGKAGNQFNEELTFEEMINSEDKKRNKMSIIVFKNENLDKEEENDIIKSKEIICPECRENIRMDIIDYQIKLHECKNGHKIENILLEKFEDTQKIDRVKIKCELCKDNNKSNVYNKIFYRCNTCKKNICPLCKIDHDKAHQIINYDDKYYICEKHNEKYNSYCEKCKNNICTLCDEHKSHKKKYFVDIMPNKNELIENNKLLKKNIDLFNINVRIIINILNEVMNKMNTYYKINEDIINNYNNKNINYEIIYNLHKIKKNNIIKELQEIIGCSGITNKFNKIFNIYSKMNINEINIIYKANEKEVRLFGRDFVNNNKKNCKIEIEGKEHELKKVHSFSIFSKKHDILEIKLKGIMNITNMDSLFRCCLSLLSLPDISNWNTSNVINMHDMF